MNPSDHPAPDTALEIPRTLESRLSTFFADLMRVLSALRQRLRMRSWSEADVLDTAVEQAVARLEEKSDPGTVLTLRVQGDPGLLPSLAPQRLATELARELTAQGWRIDPGRVACAIEPTADMPVRIGVSFCDARPLPFQLEGRGLRWESVQGRSRYYAGRGAFGHVFEGRPNDIVLPSHLTSVSRDAFVLAWDAGRRAWRLDVPAELKPLTLVLRHGRPVTLCGAPLPLGDGDVIRIGPASRPQAVLDLTFLLDEVTP